MLTVLSLPARAVEPPAAEAPVAHKARQTAEQHFAKANQAHDGHLTLDEAKGGYASIVKHFDEIDIDHKGYVTESDIKTWRAIRKTARRMTEEPDGQLRPRPAFQRGCPDLRSVGASGSQTVEPPSGQPSTPPTDQ
jgi:hypothetical protein